jgi:urease accessory protein
VSTQSELSLLRALQLASGTLPVGAYAYSQGIEWAVQAAWITDETALGLWLDEQLMNTMALTDLPIFLRLFDAAHEQNEPLLGEWSRVLIASRETSELVADDCARGRALARLLDSLGVINARPWLQKADTPFAALAAIAAIAWEISRETAASAYLWGWLEGQVMAGVRLIPLGQVAGQRLLFSLAGQIPEVLEIARDLPDDEIGSTLPNLAIASSLHETQYTRLYRS